MSGHFLFDANRCTGCGACQVACTIENGLAPGASWRRVETFNSRRHPAAPVFHLSLACNHCATAPCMNACPALAYRREVTTGAVLLDGDRCIGCGYCSWACPYDAPVFDDAAGIMTKCTWCNDRLLAGLKPACVSHCPTTALDYLPAPVQSVAVVMPGMPVTRLTPSLAVIPLEAGRVQPEMTAVPPVNAHAAVTEEHGRISLRHEWPLALFTLGAALLVAVILAAAGGGIAPHPGLFGITAAATMAAPTLHLGRKARAWRAILNVRRSWLSREVLLLSVFAAAASLWLLVAPTAGAWGWTAAAIGLAGLFSADRLYGVLPGGNGLSHSAGVTTTAVMLAGALAGSIPVASSLAGIKLLLYARQRLRGEHRGHPRLWMARVAGLIAGIAVLPWAWWPALFLLVVGEIVDRAEYYEGLARRTPRDDMDRALAGLLRDRPREVWGRPAPADA